MLALIYHCSLDNKRTENLMRYLFANLAVHLNFKIPGKIIEECVVYILGNKRDIPIWEVKKKKIEEQNEFEEGNYAIEERSVLLVGLISRMG